MTLNPRKINDQRNPAVILDVVWVLHEPSSPPGHPQMSPQHLSHSSLHPRAHAVTFTGANSCWISFLNSLLLKDSDFFPFLVFPL